MTSLDVLSYQLAPESLTRQLEQLDEARTSYLEQLAAIDQNTHLSVEGRQAAKTALESRLLVPVEEKARQMAASASEAVAKAMAMLAVDDTLTPSQLRDAESRSWLVKEDCSTFPGEQLAGLARAALAADDRVGAWLYQRYLAVRLQALDDALEMAGDNVVARVKIARNRSPIQQVLRELEQHLVSPRKAELSQRIAETRKLAGRLEVSAGTRQWEIEARLRASGRYGGM